MTIREAIIEVDRERGRSEESIRAASLFANGSIPGAKSFLETELSPEEVEPFKNHVRKKFALWDANPGEARRMAQEIQEKVTSKN